MSDETADPPKASRLPLVIGVVAAALLGGVGFYTVTSGMLFSHEDTSQHHEQAEADPALPEVRFVPLEPLLVSLNRTDPARQLRLEAQLEVPPAYEREVQTVMPRIMDVMNSYLRAVEMSDLRDPAALLRMRAQLLRRIQVITGDGRVQGLLVTKFLIS